MPVKLLTDELEIEPVLDSSYYSSTVANVIRGTYPKFSIGIYGEWGTGKTTIMKLVEKELAEESIIKVWFNAWRYEREEQFALTALMKTIAFGMSNHPAYRQVKRIMLRGLKIFGEDILEQVASTIVTENGIDKARKKLLPKTELLAEVNRETIYFDGLRKIEDEMKRIRKSRQDRRVVVFIDDLDRCSPTKALEVFESIKVFLDVEGFIFVIGLSHLTISKLISAEYMKSEIAGEDYIRKIIQIPVIVPQWSASDIEHLVEKLAEKLDQPYSFIVVENKKLISISLKPNPRELKRFINNFIIAHEIFSSIPEVNIKALLAIQALKASWYPFYLDLISDAVFRGKLRALLIGSSDPERQNELKHIRMKKDGLIDSEKKILDIGQDLWAFLLEAKNDIFNITDWELYRRAARSVDYGYEMIEVKERVRPKDKQTNRIRYLKARLKSLGESIDSKEQELDRTVNPDETTKIQDEIINLQANLKTTKSELESLGYFSPGNEGSVEIDGEVIS